MNPINPIIFQLGAFEIRWYGVLIMTGVALGAYFASRLATKRGIDPDHVWGGLILAVVLAIAGARLYHVFSIPEGCTPETPCGWYWYREHPIDAIAFWKGGFQGLGIYGAILGGSLGVIIYSWWNKVHPLDLLDLAMPGLAFGQFIGRWGNFINQELYGPPTGSDWYGIKLNRELPHFFFFFPPASARRALRSAIPSNLSVRIALVPGVLHNLVQRALPAGPPAAKGGRAAGIPYPLSSRTILHRVLPSRCLDHRPTGNSPVDRHHSRRRLLHRTRIAPYFLGSGQAKRRATRGTGP